MRRPPIFENVQSQVVLEGDAILFGGLVRRLQLVGE